MSGHEHLVLPRRLAGVALFLLLAACTSAPDAPPSASEPVIVPPPVVEVVPPVAEPPPAPVLRFAGHVASYKTLPEAEAAWPRLISRFPVLKDSTRRYVEVDLGGQRGKVVRLLVGGFADQPGALTYCRSLRSSGLYCAPHDLPA